MKKPILHETAKHYVIKAVKGFEVYRNEITHAVRCAVIGYEGDKGFSRACDECRKREA